MSCLISNLGFVYGWILTWFSHDFDDFNLILRIFDYYISNIFNRIYFSDIVFIANIIVYLYELNSKVTKKCNILEAMYNKDYEALTIDNINYIIFVSNQMIESKKYNYINNEKFTNSLNNFGVKAYNFLVN